jgi:hypothetical protein
MLNDSHKRFMIFLTAISLIGIGIAAFSTSRYGAGVSSDAVSFMSTAENLSKGHGFVDLSGEPLIFWPPLYPTLLAGFSFITRLDVFVIGWCLNILSFGMNIWLGGFLLYQAFDDDQIWAYIGSLTILLSPSLLRISNNVASDPLFITFSLAGLILAGRYLKTEVSGTILPAALLAGIASLQRFYGGALILTLTLLVLLVNRDKIRRVVSETIKLGLVAVGPLAFWLFIHNYLQNHTLVGTWTGYKIFPLENLTISLERMTDWFVPYYSIDRFIQLAFVAGIAVIILINRRNQWATWWKTITGPAILPSLLFAMIYLLLVMITVRTTDHIRSYYLDDRYQIVFLIPVLLLIYTSIRNLILPHIKLERRTCTYAISVAFVIWSIYPTHGIVKYVRAALADGEPTYNVYNTRAFHDSKIVQAIDSVITDPEAVLYSNYVNALWFYTRHQVNSTPRLGNSQKVDDDSYKQFTGWPEEAGYLVWFLPNTYEHVLPPGQLMKIADLSLIFHSDDGEIYSVRPFGTTFTPSTEHYAKNASTASTRP